MNEEMWMVHPDYVNHEVSNWGRVRNRGTGNVLDTSTNQYGVRYVTIKNTTTNAYANPSLGGLVADLFVPSSGGYQFDTVMHLNGDRNNCSADNLAWDSRWKVIAYHGQIANPAYSRSTPLIETETGTEFDSIASAAMWSHALPDAIAYAVRYNDTLAQGAHSNMVHRVDNGYVFRSL